eukprot:c27992_g2_i1 orf=452-3127(-)
MMGMLSCLYIFSRKGKMNKLKVIESEAYNEPAVSEIRICKQGERLAEKLQLLNDSVYSASSLPGVLQNIASNNTDPDVIEAPDLLLPTGGDTKCLDSYAWKSARLDSLATAGGDENIDDLGDISSENGSENEALPPKHGDALSGELQYDESEDESEASDPECERPFSGISVCKMAGDFFSTKESESLLYFEKPEVDISPSAGVIAADYECTLDSYSAQFSESPNLDCFLSNKASSEKLLLDSDIHSGHVSDPGIYQREELMPACSLPLLQGTGDTFSSEARDSLCLQECVMNHDASRLECHGIISEQSSHLKMPTLSYEHEIPCVTVEGYCQAESHGSSQSELTCHSADKVTLNPEASREVLSSNKPKSWWKVFMPSRGDIHREDSYPDTNVAVSVEETDRQGTNPMVGHASDTCDCCGVHTSDCAGSTLDAEAVNSNAAHVKSLSAGQRSDSLEGDVDALNKCEADLSLTGTSTGPAVFWNSKEWVAFSSEQSDWQRVDEWVSSIEPLILPAEGETTGYDVSAFGLDSVDLKGTQSTGKQREKEAGAESLGLISKGYGVAPVDFEHANAAFRSLNALSTVAHISGMSLTVVPSMGMYNSLKTLNLSANCIVRIIPGALPKNLHSLDLSRNRIAVIEGLRELTRLRVLNLSYNRISRIGHGLANCTLIKELYLTGNKLSGVEGLHRLLKLCVLDLSFNRLTTSKSLGQLAANYNSLLALNLLGNPVHANLGEEQLRKLIVSLVSHLTYLNKQPIKAVSAREVVMDSVARAALGSSQRAGKSSSSSRGSRRGGTMQSASLQKNRLPGHHGKKADGRHRQAVVLGVYELEKPKGHRHSRTQRHEKMVKEHGHSSRVTPLNHEQQLRRFIIGQSEMGSEGMPRSRSEGTLCVQN